jgi:hypothetical protein
MFFRSRLDRLQARASLDKRQTILNIFDQFDGKVACSIKKRVLKQKASFFSGKVSIA